MDSPGENFYFALSRALDDDNDYDNENEGEVFESPQRHRFF